MMNRSNSKMKDKASRRAQGLHGTSDASVSPVVLGRVHAALEWLLLLCPFLFGCFFPWGSAAVSLVLTVLLLLLLRRGLLCRTCSAPFLTAAAIIIFHLGGMLWGTDRGMALIGAVQFLPLPLFVLLLEQYPPDQRMGLLRRMPYAASAMVILSFLLSRIPLLESWFLVAGRQAGFFQYPNTYAVYLLFALVLVLFGSPLRFGRLPWLGLLSLGIMLSGSRIVFFLLMAVFLVFLIREKSGKARLSVLGIAGAAVLGSLSYVLITGNRESIGRFLTSSFTASEFVGRILYARDVIPVILRHPLGIGYTGFHWLQGSFQTGVYSTQHVHNEFLQLLLDVGWIPAALFLWALWKSFRSREGGFLRKLLLAVLLLHCLLDFDTQFTSVALLLFLVLDAEPQAQKLSSAGVRRRLFAGLFAASGLISVWLGTASFLFYLGHSSSALRLYPGYTAAMIDLLSDAPEADLGPLADRILRQNQSVALAHDAKARTLFSAGSFSGMREHKLEAIRLAKYQKAEYLDYFDMLIYSYHIYQENGDSASADRCLALIQEIPAMLEDADAQTSRLGRMIDEQPHLTLPPPYISWMEKYIPDFVSDS